MSGSCRQLSVRKGVAGLPEERPGGRGGVFDWLRRTQIAVLGPGSRVASGLPLVELFLYARFFSVYAVD